MLIYAGAGAARAAIVGKGGVAATNTILISNVMKQQKQQQYEKQQKQARLKQTNKMFTVVATKNVH